MSPAQPTSDVTVLPSTNPQLKRRVATAEDGFLRTPWAHTRKGGTTLTKLLAIVDLNTATFTRNTTFYFNEANSLQSVVPVEERAHGAGARCLRL